VHDEVRVVFEGRNCVMVGLAREVRLGRGMQRDLLWWHKRRLYVERVRKLRGMDLFVELRIYLNWVRVIDVFE
jgi:hypothetical protein